MAGWMEGGLDGWMAVDADGWTDVLDGRSMDRPLDGAEAMDVGLASQLHDAGRLQIVLVSGQHSSFSCPSKHCTIHLELHSLHDTTTTPGPP